MSNNDLGIKIKGVRKNSYSALAGVERGDRLIRINNRGIRDSIDYFFWKSDNRLEMEISKKDGSISNLRIEKEEDEDIGLLLESIKIRRCPNRCIFCFVDQMPPGLRASLYVKDEDYRFSFLFGNYITLTNLSKADKNRIFGQRLSPLYISVHSTDEDVRRFILGNDKAPDILAQLKEFASHNIRMHIQIVLCPVINDRDHLNKTIRDLSFLYPHIRSIAVVPVGITMFRENLFRIEPVNKECANMVIDQIEELNSHLKRRTGEDILFAADEFYIRGERKIPAIERYGELPQIENGVGMIAAFINDFHDPLLKKVSDIYINKEVSLITGVSFAPYLRGVLAHFGNVEVITVENEFFGKEITVAGLLTGRDILNKLKGGMHGEIILIPANALNNSNRGDRFLDNITLTEIKNNINAEIIKVEATGAGLIKALNKIMRRV